jgi:hypothetical protein
MGSFYLHGERHPSCTQNRAVPTHHRTPDAPRWRSRLALNVGEGQKPIGCIDSPARRWGGVENEAKMGSFVCTEKAHRTGLFRPTTALPTPPVGVPASPWTWAKARSQLGALIRLCGDGAVSNEAKVNGVILFTRGKKGTPPAHRTGLFRPTTALPTPPVGVPASPWTWAKARSQLGALIRLRGDGAVSKMRQK